MCNFGRYLTTPMRFELFFAKKLRLGGSDGQSVAPNLTIALIGIVLAIVIMILSIAVVCGFKDEISSKIYRLDSHIKIANSSLVTGDNDRSTVDSRDIFPVLASSPVADSLLSVSLIAEKPAILKTDSDFKGIVVRGVDSNFDWSYFNDNLIAGRIPDMSDTASATEILLSKTIASQLTLNVGDKILTYFIDDHVRVRNCHVVGIFSTDFEEFDDLYAMGKIGLLQNVNGWDEHIGSYVGINTRYIDKVETQAVTIYKELAQSVIMAGSPALYYVTTTAQNNISFFSWLDLLDMNVVIIIVLMTVVSAFTLIAGMLMIVLARINMIGIMKTLGAADGTIRRIFIYLTQKLVIKSLIYGNAAGIAIALLQQHFHIIKLDAEMYYIPYVPVELNWLYIVLLDVGVIAVSYITLLAPSMIISSIKPSKSIRFE